MGGITLDVVGIEDVKKALAELSKGVSDRALQDLHKEAAKVAKKFLLQDAPAKRLRKAKTVSIKPIRGKDRTAVGVGYNQRGFLARFYEKGTKKRQTRVGANRGVFNKRAFVKASYEKSVAEIIKFINANTTRIMKRSLEKYSNRLSKKLGQ